MDKKLDWNAIATVNFDDTRRKKLGIITGREAFAKAHENLRKAQTAVEQRKHVEPILKSLLIQHMVSRTPIQVMTPIQNPTETLGGLAKGEVDDGFYNTTPSDPGQRTANAKFEEVMETIPAGTELVYKSWEKQLGQWIFKGSNGFEYAIYEKPLVMFKGSAIENPGLFGLLYNTNLVNYLDNEEN